MITETQLTSEPLGVDGDKDRLIQIVSNLLGNAAKFTPAGGKITITTETRHGHALVHVRDTGIGISPDIIGTLGVPFAQAPQAIDRSRGGLGLGLAMVRSLSELHGGTVAIRSEGLGRGTEVVVSIPLASVAAARDIPAVARNVPSRRVLLIEDNRDAASSLARALALRGHVVEVAHDGREGILRVTANEFDIVFCDLGLPDLDGYEVARQLRLAPALRRVSLVALSGYALPDDVARARAAGFDAHIAKPASMDVLQALLLEPPRS